MSLAYYKLTITPTEVLSKDIQKRARELAKSRKRISFLGGKLKLMFGQLKKANADLSKLSMQQAKLKEKHPKISSTHAKKQAVVKDISSLIMYSVVEILKEIDSAASNLKKIIFNADTILYRENKTLDRLHKEVKKIKDRKLAERLTNQLNILKEKLKTTARWLYESANSPGLLKKPAARKKKSSVSEKISKLSSEAAVLEGILEKSKLIGIDRIIKNTEKELADIGKIELSIISIFPEFKNLISIIKSDIYLLESSAAGRVEEKLNAAEKNLDKTLAKISSHAEELFEEIVIIKKIK